LWRVGSDRLDYRAMPDWLKLPEGRTEIGAMHGDVAVSADGDVYVSVQGSVRQPFAILGPNSSLQVYGPDGRYNETSPTHRQICMASSSATRPLGSATTDEKDNSQRRD